tara:strand:- start:1009 stop:1374 length:366 start_codon:yes stop_codon:yes gene_type:complete
MKTQVKNKIETFLKSLNINNLEIMDYIDIEQIDLNKSFNSIYDQLNNKNAFNIEIIYYWNAIKYLKQHDASLRLSLDLANDLGYEFKNLNSEVLASILATENVLNDFYDLENKINNFFNQL